MKREFKIGERVACFGQNDFGNFDCPTIEGDRGTIVGFDQIGWVQVRLDTQYSEDGIFIFHPKQLRRLVKKKRREWILQGDPVACVSSYVHRPILGPELAMGEQVRVREVKERK